MTLQWKRQCEVLIGKSAAGWGLVVRDLRIKFEVEKTIGSTPNHALVRIYNLTPEHENMIRGEFDEMIINAGYAEDQRLIFAGNVRHALRYREGNNWITEIDAADGDSDLRNTIVHAVLEAGTTDDDVVNHVLDRFKSTKRGHILLKQHQRIRGRVLVGMARDLLTTIAARCGAHWSIQDGALQFVPVRSTLPTEAIVLRSDTGLLGAPEIDDKGIKAECLLNPRLAVNGKVWLNNNDLKAKIKNELATRPGAKKPKTTTHKGKLSRLDPDGIYKVYKLTHKGDTRGEEWQSEVHCVALDKAIPANAEAA